MPLKLEINDQIAKKFFSKAQDLRSKGGKFKYRAMSYFKAAQAIEQLDRGVDKIYKHSWLVGLQKIEGIGNRLAHEIENELKLRGIKK